MNNKKFEVKPGNIFSVEIDGEKKIFYHLRYRDITSKETFKFPISYRKKMFKKTDFVGFFDRISFCLDIVRIPKLYWQKNYCLFEEVLIEPSVFLLRKKLETF